MSVSEHITADQGLFVLALTRDDPERVRALAHADQCEACEALLEECARALVLLDEGLAEVPALDPQLAERVHGAVHAARRSRWAWLGIALGALATLLLGWVSEHYSESQAHHNGVRCFLYEQGFAVAAFGLGLVYARQRRSQLGAMQWASIAMCGALAGQAFLLLLCNANDAALHILASHVLGVAVATALGAFAGRLRSAR